MHYCILDSENIIENIIVCESSEYPESIGALPSYETARIGDLYDPPYIPTLEEKMQDLQHENTLLKAQIKAQADRSEFIEDCIAEMATTVYN